MKKWEKNEKRTKVLLDLRDKYFYWISATATDILM